MLKLLVMIMVLSTAIAAAVTTGTASANNQHIMVGSFNESSSVMSGSNYTDLDGLNVPINSSNRSNNQAISNP